MKAKRLDVADDFSVPINVGYKHQPCKHQCSERKNHPTINVVDLVVGWMLVANPRYLPSNEPPGPCLSICFVWFQMDVHSSV